LEALNYHAINWSYSTVGVNKSIVLMAMAVIQQQSTGGYMSQSISLTVSGMKCGGCENTVTKKLTELAGVISVNVSHQDKQVDVEFDPAITNADEIEDSIIEAGFSVE
jgi:copper chaperone CopZ